MTYDHPDGAAKRVTQSLPDDMIAFIQYLAESSELAKTRELGPRVVASRARADRF
jgi:hypothetical protein